MKLKTAGLFLFIFLSSCASAPPAQALAAPTIGCAQDIGKQKLRSSELQAIAKADQDDRLTTVGAIDWSQVLPRDEFRRKRVGEIFGEGCLATSADYAAAALVYQHGDVPDHYMQSFLWAKKAIELGDVLQKHSAANGLDRYLVHTGHRQLFGTQFSLEPETGLWCMEPLESTFPKTRREDYLGMSLNDSISFFLKFYKASQTASEVLECAHNLKPSPHGTMPGFW